MSHKTLLDKIYSEGYVAGEHGAPLTHNPHKPGTAESDAWIEGWYQAEHDYSLVDLDSRFDFSPAGVFLFVLLIIIVVVLTISIVMEAV